jgi:hypothetical protein
MSVQTKLARWRMLANFALCRLGDYAELLSIEAADARARLLREFIALAAVTVSGLFTLSFFCIALIASAWSKPYFLYVVWDCNGVADSLPCRSLRVPRAQPRPGIAAGQG